MSYTRITFISGLKTTEQPPRMPDGSNAAEWQAYEDWNKAHRVSTHRNGAWKPESVARLAARLGIVAGLSAYSIARDSKGFMQFTMRTIV